MKENILGYKGKFYKIGGKRLEVKENKVQDNNYYLLTLAALAKELKARKKYSAVIERVSVYPQCYGAVADRFYKYPDMVTAIYLGSWTLDVMPVVNRDYNGPIN